MTTIQSDSSPLPPQPLVWTGPTVSPLAARLRAIKATLPIAKPSAGTKDLPAGAPAAPKVAASVTLGWDPTPDPRPLVFYHLYYGTQSGALADFVATTNTSATVANLPNGGTMYFAVSVAVAEVDGNWLESDKSVEISYTVPWQPQGLTVITVQPQWSMDGGFSFHDKGSPVVLTNPQAPVILFKLSITQTNL